MSGDGGADDRAPDERPPGGDRSGGGQELYRALGVGALVLGVLAGLGVVAELTANLLRMGAVGRLVLALGGAIVLTAAAFMAAWRRQRGRGPTAASDGAAARATGSRRALRWQRRLGGAQAAEAPTDQRPSRRRRHRRGRGKPTSTGG